MERFKNLSSQVTDSIIKAQKDLWETPETGYKEWKTHAYLAEIFGNLGYSITQAESIPGFYTVLDTGRQGPTLLILAEMDSLLCAAHPDADPQTGAVHACGHHAQCAAMVGIAQALKQPGALDGMSGKIKLCLVPAEEGIEIEYRLSLIRQGIINFVDGKGEFLSRGYFDDCDLAMMVHTAVGEPGQCFKVTKGSNGLIRKIIEFNGVSSHAGGAPDKGINALYAANLALNAINALRETFKQEDFIRVHPIITKGGDAVNAIPGQVRLESYVRGANVHCIASENQKINRAIAGSAAAMGAGVKVVDIAGSLPLRPDEQFNALALSVMQELVGKEGIDWQAKDSWRSSSTDMGDMTAVMPSIQPYAMGAEGIPHGKDYYIKDVHSACVNSAKLQLMLAYRLLKDNAAEAKNIIKNARPVFKSIAEYLKYKQGLMQERDMVKYTADKIEIEL